jgi:1-acyl-sn-glycerol-3-phosphate acyltransferase
LVSWWYGIVPRLVCFLFFGRVRLQGADHIPPNGPLLIVGLHRNGATDGWAYAAALPRAVSFMISVQLRRHALGRLLVDGIEVVRDKDAALERDNSAALARCLDHLVDGALFVFPEGSSTLGPHHLPFHRGAARMAAAFACRHGPLTVVPLAIHYQAPTILGSDVDILAAPPFVVGAEDGAEDRVALESHRSLTEALEAIAVSYPDDEAQEETEAIARITDTPYGRTIHRLRNGAPPSARAALARLRASPGLRWLGLPIASERPLRRLAFGLPGMAIAALGFIANFPPVLAGWCAGRFMADGRNTVTLWRILIGVPALLAWVAAVLLVLLATGWPWLTLAYPILTVAALRLHAPARKALVEGFNGLLHPALVELCREARDAVA